jgi:glucose/galactose transporter
MRSGKGVPPMLIIGFLFFIFGFISWINAILIPYFRLSLQLSVAAAMMVTFAFYISYFVMALPSAYIIQSIGYKKGMVAGLLIMALGAILFVPAARFLSYGLFLIGLFVQATGLTLLQTAANPYVTILGPADSAARRMSLMGICNKVAGAVAPLILISLLTRTPNEIDEIKSTLQKVSRTRAEAILKELVFRLRMPYEVMAFILFLLGCLIYFSSLPDIKSEATRASSKQTLFHYPHLVLGILAIFCSVSVEVISVDSIISYAQYQGYSFLDGKYFATYTLVIMIFAYSLGILLIPKFLNQKNALLLCAGLGSILTIGVLCTHNSFSVWNLALLGFSNALIWPSIWPLALKDLGSYTEKGSAFLIMGIVGGALTPLLYGAISSQVSPQAGYIILLPLYLFLIYYALHGASIRRYSFRQKQILAE